MAAAPKVPKVIAKRKQEGHVQVIAATPQIKGSGSVLARSSVKPKINESIYMTIGQADPPAL